MTKHFEDLWEDCEKYYQNTVSPNEPANFDELILKIGLYQALDKKVNLPINDIKNAKSRLMGEILLFITQLSLKDDINVYQALQLSLNERVTSG